MDWILNDLVMLGFIVATARQAQIPPALVLGIIDVESSGDAAAARINPMYVWTMPQAKRPALCTQDTETIFQKVAWGLMQIMGATARETGFDGWLPELTVPETNIRVGTAYLGVLMSRHMARHGIDGVVAAYNAGAPRKRADGKWINQGYVDRVTRAMTRYESILKEREADLLSVDSPDEPERQTSDEPEDASGKTNTRSKPKPRSRGKTQAE